MKILIVEDDDESRETLKTILSKESFVVDTASDGGKGSYLARTNDYDVIILDNVLPVKNGKDVCKEVRESDISTPILMLSVRSEVDDKVSLLDLGVDDYMTKPYSFKELISRIKALVRRPKQVAKEVLSSGKITMDLGNFEVKKDGRIVNLTNKEYDLLEILLRNKGKVVSRGIILEKVWDINGDPMSKTVETHIMNLRRKIDTHNKIIVNVPGRGYKIV